MNASNVRESNTIGTRYDFTWIKDEKVSTIPFRI